MQITIIGAGPGISHAVARLFGAKGFQIALVARDEEKLKTEKAKLEAMGIQCMYAVGDAGDEASLNHAIDQIHADYGHAEMILYNAYARVMKPIGGETWESILQQLNVNAGGAFHVLKRELPYCKKINQGRLFFTGGGLSLYPQPNLTGLGIGKAALRNLVLGTAASVQGTNIHIATVTIYGFVNDTDPKYNPQSIAEIYWDLFMQKEKDFKTEVIY
jgi:NADP-dependent 3-hydroxy acid dehydrogenase YdfG